jgi:hypothetical protein
MSMKASATLKNQESAALRLERQFELRVAGQLWRLI